MAAVVTRMSAKVMATRHTCRATTKPMMKPMARSGARGRARGRQASRRASRRRWGWRCRRRCRRAAQRDRRRQQPGRRRPVAYGESKGAQMRRERHLGSGSAGESGSMLPSPVRADDTARRRRCPTKTTTEGVCPPVRPRSRPVSPCWRRRRLGQSCDDAEHSRLVRAARKARPPRRRNWVCLFGRCGRRFTR